MSEAKRVTVLLILSFCSLPPQSHCDPEVSVGSARPAGPKPMVSWNPSFQDTEVGERFPIARPILEGKRSRTYSFGLGKKSVLSDELEDPHTSDNLDEEEGMENMMKKQRLAWFKRLVGGSGAREIRGPGRGPNTYSFGLGKRGWFSSINYPVIKPYLGDIKRRYSFGLGKRSAGNDHWDQGSAAEVSPDDLLLAQHQ